MKSSRSIFSIALVLLVVASSARVLANSPEDVLAETPQVKLTRADYDAAMALIPAELRDEFAMSSRRLTMLLNNILLKKTLAVQAKQAGLDPDPEILRVSPEDTEAALAAARVHAIEELAGQEFDARRESLVATAQENYRVTKDKYRTIEEVKISAILISTQTRDKEAALALAKQTREKLMAGFDFAALARQVSEDKESAGNGGQLPWAREEQMNPTLWRTAFALQAPGDLSEPVLIGTSYLIVRLDDKHPGGQIPFEDVRDSILDSMRADYVAKEREQKLDAIRNDPNIRIDKQALDALIVRFDPERMKPPPVPIGPPPGMPTPK